MKSHVIKKWMNQTKLINNATNNNDYNPKQNVYTISITIKTIAGKWMKNKKCFFNEKHLIETMKIIWLNHGMLLYSIWYLVIYIVYSYYIIYSMYFMVPPPLS